MATLGFFGAAGEVTGSCYLVRANGANILVDFGMHQGEREADQHNRHLLPDIQPDQLDCVVLTHAHLDHCGRLPMLVKHGFKGPIYSTAPSCELSEIILRDSAEIQRADCERYNRRERGAGDPCAEILYDTPDVEGAIKLFSRVKYAQRVNIAKGVTITFVDAGHILGSGSVLMEIQEGDRTIRLVFSGDIGVTGSPILRDPVTPFPADVVVMESTYGDRDHRSLEATREELLEILLESQRVGAKVLIPAFAVGRTQDLIFHMGEFIRAGRISNLNVYIDSPMATETSDLYKRYREVYDERAVELLTGGGSPLAFPGLKYVRSMEESKRLNSASGCMVIIAASGMASGGRIVHHLRHNIYKPETHVVIVGYQGQGTLGRKLVDGAKRVRILGEDVIVQAKIHTLGGFSAHAGQSGLLTWATPLAKSKPTVYLTHGENGPRTALKQKLESTLGFTNVQMPNFGEVVTL
jgi:metallo-beta-lactamase family protein